MPSKRSFASALAALILLAACEPDTTTRTEFLAIGTSVSVTIYATPRRRAVSAIAQVRELLHHRGRDWYPWADGELAYANKSLARGEMPAVSVELGELLHTAARLEVLTGGRFNAAIGELVLAWGFDDITSPPDAVPARSTIEAILERAPSLQSFSDGKPPAVIIDLGGIAKGALLAESASRLSDLGIDNAIINLGGDLLVVGDAGGRPAHIGIRSPFDDSALGGLDVQPGEAVISSGNYERFFEIDGQRYHHILDPATGFPVPHTAAVTVVHSDPVLADAAATALLVGGVENFDSLVATLDLEFALLIPSSGDVVLTTGLRERLNWGLE
ncbi:MAG: FAD:protein FMN transferase [Pseudomonadota bacterium]